MASYDIIESSTAAYKLVWDERQYLIKLAAVPFVIKLICFALIGLLGFDQNFVRQALVLLPSYFADGWLLSHFVRFIFFEQRWPFRPSGDTDRDMALLNDRALGILRGTLMFVVIKFLLSGAAALLYEFGQTQNQPVNQQEVGLGAFVLALSFFVFFFWSFRLLWLYIPAAINFPIKRFMVSLGGYSASWYLIGTWLICFVPSFFVLGKVLTSLMQITGESEPTFMIEMSILFTHVVLDTIIAIITTAGLAVGFREYVIPGVAKKVSKKS